MSRHAVADEAQSRIYDVAAACRVWPDHSDSMVGVDRFDEFEDQRTLAWSLGG
jgi:hypothetical protein